MVEPTPIVERGLSGEEASARLAADGPNELPRSSARPAWKIMGEVLREPMFMLLLAGGGVYLLLGSKLEAIILLGFASFSIVLTVIAVLAEHSIEHSACRGKERDIWLRARFPCRLCRRRSD